MVLRTVCLGRLMEIASVALNHVTKVVALSPWLQMLEVHAWGMITAMSDDHALRDGTMSLSPHPAMGQPLHPIYLDPSVPVVVGVALPQDAVVLHGQQTTAFRGS